MWGGSPVVDDFDSEAIAVVLLEFEFGNEASCIALLAFAKLIQHW